MRVSNSTRYEPISNSSINSNSTKRKTLGGFLEAFRVVLSQRALDSQEYSDPNLYYPTFNEDTLLYTNRLNIIKK